MSYLPVARQMRGRRTTRLRQSWHTFLEPLEARRLLSAYNVIDLGTLGGGLSWAHDLNNSDQVVGYATTADGSEHAFLFSDVNRNGTADAGEMRDLGVLPGDSASYAHGLNATGQVVGTSRTAPVGTDGDERAVRFDPAGQPTDLRIGPGIDGFGSNANAINAASQIVGGTLSGDNYVPFVRSSTGTVTTFTMPEPYGAWGEGRAINDAGMIAGYSGGAAGDSGFIRSASGVLTPVGHANPALPYSYAWDLNDAGQVVGEGFNSAGDYRAFLWEDGSVIDLGTLPEMGSSEAHGVNNAGAVVGRAEQPEGTPGPTRGFLFRDGEMYDLNNLIPAGSGWFIADARAINDRGAIAAVAFSPAGAIRATLLVPTSNVAGRFVFYNHSAFDRHDAAPTPDDDDAIAPDKNARVGPAPATSANVTSYSRGINGAMVDLAGAGGIPEASDFDFRVSVAGPPDTWAAAPRPVSVTVRPGAGIGGSDRVTVIWADYAIHDQWLQITVLPSATTGLWAPEVFSFGNLVGEAVAGAEGGPFVVDARDVAATRAGIRPAAAAITDRHDFDRDRKVNARDLAIVRASYGTSLAVAAAEAVPTQQVTGATPLRTPKRSAWVELLRKTDMYS